MEAFQRGGIRAFIALVTCALSAALASGCSSSSPDDDVYLSAVRGDVDTQRFSCGASRCRLGAEYCAVTRLNVRRFGDPAVAYGCETVPTRCAAWPHCNCLALDSCTEEHGALFVEQAQPGE